MKRLSLHLASAVVALFLTTLTFAQSVPTAPVDGSAVTSLLGQSSTVSIDPAQWQQIVSMLQSLLAQNTQPVGLPTASTSSAKGEKDSKKDDDDDDDDNGNTSGSTAASTPPLAPGELATVTYELADDEKYIPGYSLIVGEDWGHKGAVFEVKCGPALALATKYIQAGDQGRAVGVLQAAVKDMDTCLQQNPTAEETHQSAATRESVTIGLSTMPSGQTAVAFDAKTGTFCLSTVSTPNGVNTSFANAVSGGVNESSPIVLDLNGNGLADVTSQSTTGLPYGAFVSEGAVRFDLSGRGLDRQTEWLKPGQDGLLALDANGNGVVDSAAELFGDADGFSNGYAKLSMLDTNRDGILTGEELSELSVWIDQTGDGVCQPGELTPVSNLAISQIACTHSSYRSQFVRNGQVCKTWDWYPRSN